ncbi:MAG TPA: D-alanyl-D-alanine carboxypeptidase family protein, partial [Pontiella sp.]
MKKSNVTFIAAALIAVHVLIFIAVIGKRERNIKNTSSAPPPAAENHQDSEPLSLPNFKVPELELPEPALPDAKPRTIAVPESRELIATPGTQTGYLRYNRPDRRTTKVYSSLVSTPYQGAIVVDARTGKILFENRAAAYAYPASVTKLMTLLIVLEQIDAGKVRLDDKITITREVSGIGGSEIFLDVRESGVFTVDDMLNALIIHSANDAARALAVHVAGTREAFVDMMNKKARELGMNSTVYHSEHGLPPEAGRQPDISTAYDIAILSLACLRHTETLGYTGTKLAWLPLSPIRKEKFMLANRNALVGREPYPGCDGLKTGYHKIGGWSLAATAERDGQRIISVVLGAPDKTTR